MIDERCGVCLSPIRYLRTGLFCVAALIPVASPGQLLELPATALSRRVLPAEIHQILALGAADFQTRKQAGQQILARPLGWHDWLYRAQYSTDPEIANASRMLRRRMCRQGLLVQAAPEARTYARGDVNERQRVIERFGMDRSPGSTHALLGIVKYELDEPLSRLAAVELISGDHDSGPVRAAIDSSPRTGAHWLRVWFDDSDPREFVDDWDAIVRQITVADHGSQPVQFSDQVARLMRRSAVRYWGIGESTRAEELIWYLAHSVRDDPLRLTELLDWLLYQQQYQCAERFVRCHAEQYRTDPRLVIRMAELCKIRGQVRKAGDLADQVKRQLAGDPAATIEVAVHLRDSGLEDWAICLLNDSVQGDDPMDDCRITALRILSSIHQDRQNFRQAATTLDRIIGQLAGHPDSSQRYPELQRQLVARAHYCWHRHFLEEGAVPTARNHLLAGLQACPGDSALLIAADGFPDATPGWKPAIAELIGMALQRHEREIQMLQTGVTDDPQQSGIVRNSLASELNAYAWLAARTGNNLEQAEQYSRWACRIAPCDAHILDTASACLHARGKYREAIAWQVRAIELSPLNPSLQSGLNRYRQALAATSAWPGLFR